MAELQVWIPLSAAAAIVQGVTIWGMGKDYRDFFGFGSGFLDVFSIPTGHSVFSGQAGQ